MLIRFRTANHRSVHETAELTFAQTRQSSESPDVRVAAIYGANASGKSNVLGALAFMRGAVLASHTQWQPEDRPPRWPFALDPEARDQPSLFELDVLLDGVRF